MAQVSRSVRLVSKAEAAFLAAIEIYNKPDFQYRDESFVILAVNAWELLAMAKLLAENDNDLRSLYVYETRRLATGAMSNRKSASQASL